MISALGRASIIATCVAGAGLAAPLPLGMTTHFSQGWPPSAWTNLESLPPVLVRDGIAWTKVETVKGQHVFTAANSGHIERICASGRRVQLAVTMQHPLHDGGLTVHTPAGRAAVGAWARAQVLRFGDCIEGVQIGNEINAAGAFKGPAAADIPTNYVAIVRAVRDAVKPIRRDIRIHAGSTNAIGTGFLIRLFDAGLLDVADTIVVHPYRRDSANVDWELRRLKAAMAERGKTLPIVALEFSFDSKDEVEAADFLTRMLVLMASEGVAQASWYALIDTSQFPTMGLFTRDGREKTAGRVFRRFSSDWSIRQTPVRLHGEEPSYFHFRLAPDRQIVWGAPRGFQVSGTAAFFDAAGNRLAKPALLGLQPIIVEGPATVTPLAPRILADTLLDFGTSHWSYWGRRGSLAEVPMLPVDWTWGSFINNPTLRPASINQRSLAVSGAGASGIQITHRWQAPRAQTIRAIACMRRLTTRGDGLGLRILKNGAPAGAGLAGANPLLIDIPLSVRAGDIIDFEVGPNADGVGDRAAHRFQIATGAADLPTC